MMAQPHTDLAGFYDRLAPDYNRLHRRRLRHAGGEAQAALEATVRALASPRTALLDAGCGTGAFARQLITEGLEMARMTLLDPSEAMLARCDGIPAQRRKGGLENLPFPDSSFDIVTCAWALETVAGTDRALSELCRVVRPGGVLCLAFCSEKPVHGPSHWLTRQAMLLRGGGRLLCEHRVIDAITGRGGFDVRSLPCAGPASALIARRCLVS